MLAAGAGAVAFFLTGFVVGSYMDLFSSTFVLHRITGNFQGAILYVFRGCQRTQFLPRKSLCCMLHISVLPAWHEEFTTNWPKLLKILHPKNYGVCTCNYDLGSIPAYSVDVVLCMYCIVEIAHE